MDFVNHPEGKQVIRHVANHLVKVNEPEELEFFDELISAYFAKPEPPTAKESSDPIAFGIEGLASLWTPAAAAMVSAAITYIASQTVDALAKESAATLVDSVKKKFNPKDEKNALTKEQLEAIHKIAIKEGAAFGLTRDDARKMAKSLVGTLVLKS